MVETDPTPAAPTGQDAEAAGPGGKGRAMDWEGFFTHYRKPGFIPGYEIVNKLGSGVFGEVYKARKESIGKFYAIKFLKVSDEKVSEAIFKELDTLRYFAQLDHPNLVSIEDKGEVMGIPYIVMGYAGDRTLKKRLAQGPVGHDEVTEVFSQVCAGVAALHEKSIIHFDLKPANVFMNGPHARVGDYGLSKLVSESQKTMSIGRGTPYYMAPEMLRRKGDHRSDIYSLGVILYEMVTGDVPFKGDSEWEVLKKHETEAVDVPAHVPEPLHGIILRSMEKRPEARFQSVREILAVLDGRNVAIGSAQVADGREPSPAPAPFADPESSEAQREAFDRFTGKWFPAPERRRALVTPPPLPTARRFKRRYEPGSANRVIRRNVRDVVTRIRRAGGETAERARVLYQEARSRAGNGNGGEAHGFDSFYADFEAPDGAGSPAPAAAAPPRRRSALVRAILFLLWPVRIVFRALGAVLRTLGRGLLAFFRNFFRYSVVLIITAALVLLVHAALRGFDFDRMF